MTSSKKPKTVNVRIYHSTHEELKLVCEQDRKLLGGLVDQVLFDYIQEWKARNNTDINSKR